MSVSGTPNTGWDPWAAPTPGTPLNASVTLPGSKSQTSRALLMSVLSGGPVKITGALASRDSLLAAKAAQQFGASLAFAPTENLVTVTPPTSLRGGFELDVGLAGTVMRFGAALAAFSEGPVRVVGDRAALRRPIGPLMDALEQLGAEVTYEGEPGFLPLSVRKATAEPSSAPVVRVATSSSSQYLSALLLASPLFPDGTIVEAVGTIPSWPYVALSLEMLAEQGIHVEQVSSQSWRSQAGKLVGSPITVEPDLANAGPFLAAALLLGGSVTIKDWPAASNQVGKYWEELLPRFGASLAFSSLGMTVTAPAGLTWPGQDFNLEAAGELAPTIAALCLFATSPSTLTGIGHLRGHETDRLSALAELIQALGARAEILDDGIRIFPAPLTGTVLSSYEDHRMATFGALVGLRIPDCTVENIETTDKTLPNFPLMWKAMIEGRPSPAPPRLTQRAIDEQAMP